MKFTCLVVIIATFDVAELDAQSNAVEYIGSVPAEGRMLLRRLEAGQLSAGDDGVEILKLSKLSGITPPLMDLLKKTYDQQTNEDIAPSVFYALDQRRDLSEQDLEWMRRMLDEQVNKPTTAFTQAFKERGLLLLRHYPSQANEDILIQYLQPANVTGVVSFGGMAAISLKQIGTARAIKALEAFRETCAPEFGDFKDATKALDSINAREGLKPDPPRDASGPTKMRQEQIKSPNHPQAATPNAPHEPTSQGWLVWLLVVIAATVGAAWVFLRKSK